MMFGYYSMFILSVVFASINNAGLMKKYQLTAGTGIYANIIFMLINGAVSAALPAGVIIVGEGRLETTVYSLVIALITVLCASVSMIGMIKAYEVASVAMVNLFQILGTVLISCLWGVCFLGENISIIQIIAIGVILAAVFLITGKREEKMQKKALFWYLVVFVSSGFLNVLTKVHQVEEKFETIDTLSFSVWIGVLRVIVFAALFFVVYCGKKRNGMVDVFNGIGKKSVGIAALSSAVSGTCYIVTLIAATVLPITTTAPLNTGISIGMSAILPWMLYGERLTKREILGIGLSLMGILMYM
ncbi:MAG: hypothetical protein IJZ85_01195 [Lachnospiraceae bacterium]|nr:hypothetical protein [Lachnospiraceae bacterium]